MLHSSWGYLMVCANDHVGERWSNLVEGVELSLTPPLFEKNWYAVPLQQPVWDSKEGITLDMRERSLLNYCSTQLSFTSQLT